MFSFVKKFFGLPLPEDLRRNGAHFLEHLEKLDDPNLPVGRIRDVLDEEGLGRLLRHAQHFPWSTDDETVARWKAIAQGAFAGQNFWLEYRTDLVEPDYLVFDVLRSLAVSPADFYLSQNGFTENDRLGPDGEKYNHFMVHQPIGEGYALLFRIRSAVAVEGVLKVGTCRVFIGKRRQESLAQWDREMTQASAGAERFGLTQPQ